MYQLFFKKISQRAWNSRTFALPSWHKNYPTMLTREEMHLLAFLSEHTPVDGSIIDLGAFLGGSTISFAYGVERAKNNKKIHSYDRWKIDEKMKYSFLYKKGHSFAAGENAFPIFEKFTKPFHRLIEPHIGDILTQNWNKDNAISILFIDLSKTKVINDHIIKEFFPALKSGSIIVQQDFLFFRNPWLYTTMAKLSNSIELLSHTEENSVIFGVHSPPKCNDLESCLSQNTTQEETIHSIKYFQNKFTNIRQLEMIDALLGVIPFCGKVFFEEAERIIFLFFEN
jgi:predicted O-methyltransferase YrrM